MAHSDRGFHHIRTSRPRPLRPSGVRGLGAGWGLGFGWWSPVTVRSVVLGEARGVWRGGPHQLWLCVVWNGDLVPFVTVGVSKHDIRQHVWDYLESHNLADFPRPVHHRIPNFKVGGKAGRRDQSDAHGVQLRHAGGRPPSGLCPSQTPTSHYCRSPGTLPRARAPRSLGDGQWSSTQGAAHAAQLLLRLQVFQAARTVKVNPDAPQRNARFLVLEVSTVRLSP